MYADYRPITIFFILGNVHNDTFANSPKVHSRRHQQLAQGFAMRNRFFTVRLFFLVLFYTVRLA